jgi:flagellar motor switch protein FliM
MPDVLSQQEIDALLSMTGEPMVPDITAPSGKKRVPDKVRSHNFKAQRKITDDPRRTLESIHRSFATLLTSAFSTMQKTIVDVAPPHIVDEMPYSDFVVTLLNPSCSYIFNMQIEENDPVRAVIDFSPNLAFSFIDRLFGGKGEANVQNRPLTHIEEPVMEAVAERALVELARSWTQFLDIQVFTELDNFQPNPDFLQIASHEEVVVFLSFEVSSPSLGSMMINLCYPFSLLEPIMDMLNPRRALSTKRKSSPAGPQIQKYLENVPSEIRVQLGAAHLTIRDLLSLQKGDVVALNTRINDPSIFFVGDKPKFLARPGRLGRSLAVEILRPIPLEEEDKYQVDY